MIYMKKGIVIIALLLSAFVLFAAIPVTEIEGLQYPTELFKKIDTNTETAKCVEVIDENTIKVVYKNFDEPEMVTMIGISNLEDEHARKKAIAINKNFLINKELKLSYDWQGMNKEGEILAYVWVPVSTGYDCYNLFWNIALLINGYGKLNNEPMNVFRAVFFYESYEQAREKKMGIWKTISTEEPLKFGDLHEDVQAYLIEKYHSDEEKPETTNEEETTSSVSGSFINQLLLGLSFGMTYQETRDNIVARPTSKYLYEGTNFGHNWQYRLSFSLLSGQGENVGMKIERLRTIRYNLLGTYNNNEIFEIYSDFNELFKKEMGQPLEENNSPAYATWILPEEKLEIRLHSGDKDMIIIEYTGDLTFE